MEGQKTTQEIASVETIKNDPPKTKKEIVIKINRNSILTVLVLVLIIISGLQAIQLVLLRNKIISGLVKPVSASTSSSSNTSSTPSSGTSNLPDMAGGC